MKLSEFYNEVSRRTDTSTTKINTTETRRVLSEAFLVLSKMKGPEMADVIAKGLATAARKSSKK